MINFSKIQKKWQKKWEEKKIFKVKEDPKMPKYYVLEMFPYPSSTGLHMGHAFNYTIGDIYTRFKRMCGFNVLYPMGYDALGLPAENAAIQAKIHPKKFTNASINNFIKQQKSLGLSYDWDRMVKTCEPEYYKWNQYFFLKFMEKGLVYRKKAPVNWCPKCNTVLANEQVHDGKCWRHKDTDVDQKALEQWFIKTTAYAEELLEYIPKLEWPERIKIMQENWIGRSEGVTLKFDVVDENGKKIDEIETYTTRADTVYGITYLVLAAEHPKVIEWTKGTKYEKKVKEFIKKVKKQSIIERTAEGKEKNGVFLGKYFINPFTGEKCPLWVADYALFDYGTGAVMAVPTHDQRDFEFAKKYKLPLRIVISPSDWDLKVEKMTRSYVDDGVMVNSAGFNGMHNRDAMEAVADLAEEKEWGKRTVNYKLKDWLISRQRYWGTPIPVIHCTHCAQNKSQFKEYKSYLMGASEITDKELEKFGIKIVGKKKSTRKLLIPNEKIEDYLNLIEKKLDRGFWNEVVGNEIIFIFKFKDGKTKRFVPTESNTKKIAKLCSEFNDDPLSQTEDLMGYLFDNEFYADYIEKIKNSKEKSTTTIIPVPEKDLPIILPEDVKFGKGNPLATNAKFVNVKCPKCGGKAKREIDTMDTFFDSSWYFLRYCDNKNIKNAFDKNKVKYWMPVDQYIGGAEHACMHLIYARFFTKALRDLGFLKFDEPFTKLFNQGMLHKDGFVMSKSRGNVVLPETVSKKYGIDTARFFLVSIASPDKDLEWSDTGIEGSLRFVNKVMHYFNSVKVGKSSRKVESKLNKAIKGVTDDIESFRYNFAIIKIRELFDSLEGKVSKDTLEKFLKLLHPFCPHITEELWEKIGNKGFISLAEWPKYDESKIDLKAEAVEDMLHGVISDITSVLELSKVKNPKKVILFVSEPWKYKFFTELKKQLEKTFNIGEVIKAMIKGELKKYGKDVSKLVPKFVNDTSKIPKVILDNKTEFDTLVDSKSLLKEEFKLSIEVVKAQDSREEKAKNSYPSKPAILVE